MQRNAPSAGWRADFLCLSAIALRQIIKQVYGWQLSQNFRKQVIGCCGGGSQAEAICEQR